MKKRPFLQFQQWFQKRLLWSDVELPKQPENDVVEQLGH